MAHASAYVVDLEERRTYVGASEAAAAVGLSPWQDPIALWESKVDPVAQPDSSFRMKLGAAIEPLVGTFYEEETGLKLRAGGARTRRMKGHPWIGAHPDFAVIGLSRIVQAKLSDDFGRDVDDPESIPLHYRLQALAEMAVTGAASFEFAVVTGRAFTIYPFRAEPGAMDDLVADLDDFWHEFVEKKVPPPPTDKSSEALGRRYPQGPDTKLGKIASAGQEETLRALLEAHAALPIATAELERLKNEVKAMIGDAYFIEGAGKSFRWGTTTRMNVAWKPIAMSYRAAIEQARGMNLEAQAAFIDGLDLDAVESLFTETSTSRGPFTIAEIR